MKHNHQHKKGFTLVELLVVIAIIAVLAGLAAPAIMNALKRAKVTKTAAICTAFETAINNFESEYSFLPYGGGSIPTADTEVDSDDDVVAVLCGVEEDINFKQIKFFEQGAAKGESDASYRDGLHIDGDKAALYDPWGEKYKILIDYDQDGELTPSTGHSEIDGNDVTGKKSLIFSKGPEKQINNDTSMKEIPRNW